MKKLFKGFTLAEVLITLGIIGVVAAVTLPSLQVNVNQQALSTQVTKTYSQFTHAIQMYMQQEGLTELDANNFRNQDALTGFARNHLQVQYVCAERDPQCFADQYTYIDGAGTLSGNGAGRTYIDGNSFGGILKDGTHFVISSSFGNVIPIFFDVNGRKGPNKVGYDLFVMRINPDGSIGRSRDDIFGDPDELAAETERLFNACKNGTGGRQVAYGCFLHLQQNNFRFDY